MMQRQNAYGQPIGLDVQNWTGSLPIPAGPIEGVYCTLSPFSPQHATGLYDAFSKAPDDRLWTYMPTGPFGSAEAYAAWVDTVYQSRDPAFYAIICKKTNRPLGVASFLRINPDAGSVEVGYITFSPDLQQTAMATEAMYLMMRLAFEDLGYRRYEWKCDALNAASRKAAVRLGFTFEGVFRQALVYKGRNRDTAWFSILDGEWPKLRAAFQAWLAPTNFDAEGRQQQNLAQFMSD